MLSKLFLLAGASLPLSHAETVLGVYIFSRHGDRTAKSTPPTVLTDLGYQEVFTSGTYFRNRYIASNATSQIAGINPDLVSLSQITASAPMDNVLMPSTEGFLQGLYPPVGATLGSSTLRNGTIVEAPLGGYQLIPVQTVTTGTGSENTAWLQGQSNCANAILSSNEYFSTPAYTSLLDSTMDFYQNLVPVVNATFSSSQVDYKNAYALWDLINVATIHNSTINDSSVLTNDTLFQVRTLADTHEFNLAYNASDPIRAISGATLGAQILQALAATVAGNGAPLFNVQFGTYASFQSFFGLAGLTSVDPQFFGIPDYASTMTFELVTNSSASPLPPASEIGVRFFWHNGTTSNISEPVPFPLFGFSDNLLTWSQFSAGMNNFAIGNQTAWCQACGNSTGICAPAATTSSSGSGSSPTSASSSSSGGMSKAVAGVIGAMVTLAVVLGIEALIMLIGGLRLVSKRRLAGTGEVAGNGNGAVPVKA